MNQETSQQSKDGKSAAQSLPVCCECVAEGLSSSLIVLPGGPANLSLGLLANLPTTRQNPRYCLGSLRIHLTFMELVRHWLAELRREATLLPTTPELVLLRHDGCQSPSIAELQGEDLAWKLSLIGRLMGQRFPDCRVRVMGSETYRSREQAHAARSRDRLPSGEMALDRDTLDHLRALAEQRRRA